MDQDLGRKALQGIITRIDEKPVLTPRDKALVAEIERLWVIENRAHAIEPFLDRIAPDDLNPSPAEYAPREAVMLFREALK